MPVRARALALTALLLNGLLVVAAPPAPTAAAGLKVAIIVGPTAITDSHYFPLAKEVKATAEAAGATVDLRYCATPSQVKAATNGANVIVYFGHGNGFPNPYSNTELTDRTNGFGLRDPAKSWGGKSCTDTVLRYYGEDHLTGKISTNGWGSGGLTPAPGFVMVMSNACYAPGAGESRPAPAESVALERVANYSTPFLALGGTYFATDLGSDKIVDLILRNPSTAFGILFEQGNGYAAAALKRHPHPDYAGQEVWVHRTKNQWLGDDYWYAFAGDPGRAPNGSVPGYAAMHPFTDSAGSKFHAAIAWVYEHGIMDGCTETEFCHKQFLTRGALAQALADGLGLPPTDVDYYPDDTGHRYEDGINRLTAAGLTRGCGNGDYCPEQRVRRGPLATAIAWALNLPTTETDYFTDDDGSRHEANINRIAAAGISGGCGAGEYCPEYRVRRAQAAAVLRNTFD